MKQIFGPVVGAVTRTNAKIWIFWSRSHVDEAIPECHVFKDEACTKRIDKFPFTIISSSVHESGDIYGLAGLTEVTFPSKGEKFYFKIISTSVDDRQNDQIYSIQPFPEPNTDIDRLSFGIISCHKPSLKPNSEEKTVAKMWRYLADKMKEHDCRFLIQSGDQVYCDHDEFNAWKMSLKTDSQEKRLWYYREAYLKSWNFPDVQHVMQTYPQYMIWDDHDITNGWGSDRKHARDPKCKAIFEVARQAYIEFQHSYNPAPLREGEQYYAFNYGPVAFLVMDIRGHRDIGLYNKQKADEVYPLAGKEQWDDISAWLNSEVIQKSKVLFVINSVPVIHLSRKFGSLGIFKNDICDQWSTPHNRRERRILLKMLYDWSGEGKRPVFILSGDVHVGTYGNIKELETGRIIYQISSSPITNDPAYYLDFFLQICSSKFDFHLDKDHKRPVHGEIVRRCRRRNFVIMDVQFKEQIPQVTLNMYEERKAESHRVDIKLD